MRYLSVCSGIEAATVAWHPLGWEAAAYSEIEAFPRAVLTHHYPDTPLHGDFTTIGADEYGPIDLLVGGTPCQSFSVAGLRGGLADDRGNLALQFLKLAQRTRPEWVVWENVPGVLSSNGGRDFGSILGGLGELGYGWTYRVLDAQFFGVPQRRRRVFVVGHLGDWRRAAAVLFERHSLSGHPAPRRESRAGPTGTIEASLGRSRGAGTPVAALTANGVGTCGADDNQAQAGHLIGLAGEAGLEGFHRGLTASTGDISHCLNAGGMGRQDYETETLIAQTQFDDIAGSLTARHDSSPCDDRGMNVVCFSAKDHGADASDISPTLRSGSHSGSHANGGVMPAVAFAQNVREEVRLIGGDGQLAGAVNAEQGSHQTTNLATASAVRRITPRECERLQGFPDDYTLIPYRGKPAADGPRYKALGNSMAVPVMRWIGERIRLVEQLQTQARAA